MDELPLESSLGFTGFIVPDVLARPTIVGLSDKASNLVLESLKLSASIFTI